jgi:stage III sporulation protein SpoIIIAA
MQQWIDTDLEAIFEKLPPHIAQPLVERQDNSELLEVILDLGRTPEARFLDDSMMLSTKEVTGENIEYVIQRIGPFGVDNRAGMERTLHRISAIRNRSNKVVGLTLRLGRAVYGTIKIVEDLILTGKSVLLLGRPGVGKTTMLREVARVLADDAHKRVVVVDTSNEIAGDGDIPHPGIGRARRMQVHSPMQQHAVMIEAVENHMPEVIVIDEIGTELEASAARTIAERGVQLVATAHGNTLENLVLNPTLSDLVGGIHTVTLGDDEARRRRSQKTVLERRAPPTFDILIEIQGWSQVAIHTDVADVVDRMLRGFPTTPEQRTMDKQGMVRHTMPGRGPARGAMDGGESGRFSSQPTFYFKPANDRLAPDRPAKDLSRTVTHILPYGVNKGKLQQAVRESHEPIELVADIGNADLLLTTKNYYRRRTQALRQAEEKGKPVYVLRKNTTPQIHQFLKAIARGQSRALSQETIASATKEAEEATARVDQGDHQVELSPQGAYIRHLQHQIAEERGLSSSSSGREPSRHVVIYRA